ncbi:cytochrome-c peroxidase [Massilia horti]|uniref:C-type cytochrome n=1 Tax=Massilia horti TaxID=2562153 RepID=A0A4Y9T671_9BURK|nr:cytochrome c peroxidase [Massilia horti]TFW32655.1 c-type cytochrome [Massilia horti]
MDQAVALHQTSYPQHPLPRVSTKHNRAARAFQLAAFTLICSILLGGCNGSDQSGRAASPDPLDEQLAATLTQHGFTGTVEQRLEERLGRKLDPKLVDIGRLLFFDQVSGLHNDNSCAGCHSPTNGFGDTQSIAIGIQSNLLVGPNRRGPRNQRRTPSVVNSPFYPKLMWNGRFFAPSGDPFDNSMGFSFPQPEGTTRFRPNDPVIRHLLIAQAHMPPTELNEAAGFTGIRDGIDPRYYQFDDGKGEVCPALDATGFRNDPIRARVEQRLNAIPGYVEKFAEVFSEVRSGARIDIAMFARAIAEFEFSLKGANAPIDRFARGETTAMTQQEKRGALLFFGKANCVACHAVSGNANEMFSDFKMHNIGVPQIAPVFGVGSGDTIFDGPGEDEDYGLAQISGLASDRYQFRTSPLRNAALQPAYFHNGAFTLLDDAIGHHLDVLASLHNYDAKRAGVAPDLVMRMAPIAYVAATIDPLVRDPLRLSRQELDDLIQFVRTGLLDERMLSSHTCSLVPKSLPNGAQLLKFETCQ